VLAQALGRSFSSVKRTYWQRLTPSESVFEQVYHETVAA